MLSINNSSSNQGVSIYSTPTPSNLTIDILGKPADSYKINTINNRGEVAESYSLNGEKELLISAN